MAMPNFQHADQLLSVSPQENQGDCACKSVAAILFGNGSDCKLCPLMRRRSAGAIPLGAKYRLIDAVVSNCINSNITKLYALTQFNSTSLNSHLTRTYSNVGLGKEEFLQVIAACQSPENQSWFQGNADAVRRFLWMLEECPATEFLILPGYHLYRMDYQDILQLHHETRADITISALRLEERHDKGFGILKVDSDNKVLEIFEKETAFPLVGNVRNSEDNNHTTYASMGIYVISKDVMVNILKEDLSWANDFKSEVIPGAVSLGMKNMETKTSSKIPIGIGQGSFIRKAIIDKNARIGKRVKIINNDNIQEGSREDEGIVIREGIVIITRNAIVPDDTIL
uniref:Nucleotidyl transferase domain-containing protein n=1 Tax=Chenopodium quinoa TaxID=63459 RepID=A0A803KTY5_CHEQI